MKPLNTGIPAEDRAAISEGLSCLLADSYRLALKTQNVHWNVTGPQFHSIHQLTELQYGELALAVDEIAERIRALGHPAPASYDRFATLSSIEDMVGTPSADEMVRELTEGHEAAARTARSAMPAAEAGTDEATADLLTQRISAHEKTAWMLRSLTQ